VLCPHFHLKIKATGHFPVEWSSCALQWSDCCLPLEWSSCALQWPHCCFLVSDWWFLPRGWLSFFLSECMIQFGYLNLHRFNDLQSWIIKLLLQICSSWSILFSFGSSYAKNIGASFSSSWFSSASGCASASGVFANSSHNLTSHAWVSLDSDESSFWWGWKIDPFFFPRNPTGNILWFSKIISFIAFFQLFDVTIRVWEKSMFWSRRKFFQYLERNGLIWPDLKDCHNGDRRFYIEKGRVWA